MADELVVGRFSTVAVVHRSLVASIAVSALCAPGVMAASHTFWIAAQHDWPSKTGFYLSVESRTDGDACCGLPGARLVFGVADGREWRYVIAQPEWKIGPYYCVRAVIGADSSELWLDGRSLGRSEGRFQPAECDLTVNTLPSWAAGPSDYVVRVRSVKLTSGSKKAAFTFTRSLRRSPVLFALEPQSPARAAWTPDPDKGITIEAVFSFGRRPSVAEAGAVIDRYGQCRLSDWNGKIKNDQELRDLATEEDRRLALWGEPQARDRFGGYTDLGWKDKGTGFYRVTKRDGFWWLLTPEGNPCFYTAVCTAPGLNWEMTPVTGRESLFEWLPPREGDFAACWGKGVWGGDATTEYVAPHTANLIRKYGSNWRTMATDSAARRLRCWGFSGVGKWGGIDGVASTPVLQRGRTPKLVDHPDVFDEVVRAKLRDDLRAQIEPRRKDPWVLGWSLGNELAEIVTSAEIREVLKRPATPAKRALIEHAVNAVHGGDVASAAKAWGVEAKSMDDLLGAIPNAPAQDIESMRRFYADRYYAFVYKTVKELDPDHLYLGFWIVPGWWENEEDWQLISSHCDVIGYDLYSFDFASPLLMRLICGSDKPILCGEFSFPPFHGGERGYGVYSAAWARDDAEAGMMYRRFIEAAARHPLCVGAMWFHYRDQPITGRGLGTHRDGLVDGEHYAFGVVDVTDRPKWALVERMREANLAAARWRMSAASKHP